MTKKKYRQFKYITCRKRVTMSNMNEYLRCQNKYISNEKSLWLQLWQMSAAACLIANHGWFIKQIFPTPNGSFIKIMRSAFTSSPHFLSYVTGAHLRPSHTCHHVISQQSPGHWVVYLIDWLRAFIVGVYLKGPVPRQPCVSGRGYLTHCIGSIF